MPYLLPEVDLLTVLFSADLHCSCDVPCCILCSKEQETLFLHLTLHFVSPVPVFDHCNGKSDILSFCSWRPLSCTARLHVPEIYCQGMDLMSCDFMNGSWGHGVP